MDFVLLADRIEAIPRIAAWYFDQWGHLDVGAGAKSFEDKLQHFLCRDKIPLMILAIEHEEILGVAQLKFREMDIYPEREHWLGGVYVPAQHRGKGIAAQVVSQALRIASSLGVAQLHLQTEQLDGGLYARLGWVPSEQVNYRGIDVLVMENDMAYNKERS